MSRLIPEPRLSHHDANGKPYPGALCATFLSQTNTPERVYQNAALTIEHENPVQADDFGRFPPMYGNAGIEYKLYLTDSSGGNPRTIDPASPITLTQAEVGFALYPQSAAEILASATPANYSYPWGHFLRYGAIGDGTTNNATAWSKMLLQAQQSGGAPAYVPAGTFRINAGVTLSTGSIRLIGAGIEASTIITSDDISPLSFALASSYSEVEDIGFVGKGLGATLAGLHFNNSNTNLFRRVKVIDFGYGARFVPGANSCYLNKFMNCRVYSNRIANFKGDALTNALTLVDVEAGSGNSPIGVQLIDSTDFNAFNLNCEGVTVCSVDLDSSGSGSVSHQGHTLINPHFETAASQGDIRIGNTAVVRGVTIIGGYSNQIGGCDCGINAVNVDGLSVFGHTVAAGYDGASGYLKRGNVTNERILLGGAFANHYSQYIASTGKVNASDAGSLLLDAATLYDAAYGDSTHYNLYKLNSGSMLASKNYYAGLDVARVENSGSPGSGAKLYARGMICSDAIGGTTRKGAAYMKGDVDIEGAVSFGQSVTAPTLASSGTIATVGVTVTRVTTAGAVTGIILQAGTMPGQQVQVINQSGNSITFAAAGTSNVADGTGCVIPANKKSDFTWSADTSRWYSGN